MTKRSRACCRRSAVLNTHTLCDQEDTPLKNSLEAERHWLSQLEAVSYTQHPTCTKKSCFQSKSAQRSQMKNRCSFTAKSSSTSALERPASVRIQSISDRRTIMSCTCYSFGRLEQDRVNEFLYVLVRVRYRRKIDATIWLRGTPGRRAATMYSRASKPEINV